MSEKLSVGLAVLAAVAALVLGALYYGARVELQSMSQPQSTGTDGEAALLQEKVKSLQSELSETTQSVAMLRERLENAADPDQLLALQSELNDAQVKVSELQREINTLSQEKTKVENERSGLLSKISILESELAAAKTDTGDETPAATGNPEDVARLQREADELNEQLAQLEMVGARQAKMMRDQSYEIDTLKGQLAEMKKQLDEAKSMTYVPPVEEKKPDTTVKPALPTMTNKGDVPDLTFSIVQVNSSFAVIDQGKDKGVEVGWILYVFREGAPVGLLEVINVDDEMSTTEVLLDSEGRDVVILPSDVVRTLNQPPN